jgi:hypothetical protein
MFHWHIEVVNSNRFDRLKGLYKLIWHNSTYDQGQMLYFPVAISICVSHHLKYPTVYSCLISEIWMFPTFASGW